jgi:hypothetical protein
MTGNRSVWGLDALKKKSGVVCQSCCSPAEEAALLREMGTQIVGAS